MTTAELEQHAAKMNDLRAEWRDVFRPQRETLQSQGKSEKEIAMTEYTAWGQWLLTRITFSNQTKN